MLAAKCANYLAKANKWVRAAQANDKCRNIETMETLSTWWVPQFPQNGDRETLLRKNLSWKWNCSGRLGSQPSMVCGAQNTNVLATDPPQPKQLQLICKLLRCCSVPQRYFFDNISSKFNIFSPSICVSTSICDDLAMAWMFFNGQCVVSKLYVSFFKAGPGCFFNTEAGNKTVVSDLKPFQNVVPKFHSFDNGMSNFNFAQHIPSYPSHPWYELGEHGLVISTELLALKPWHGLAVWPSCG